MKPNFKQLITINLVNNIPTAIAIPTAAFSVTHTSPSISNWLINVLLAFVVSFVVFFIFPFAKISKAVPIFFHIPPKSLVGRLLGNLPVNLINVLIIGTTLNYYNIRQFPDFIYTFLATILPIYFIAYIVSTFANILADKLAFGTIKPTN